MNFYILIILSIISITSCNSSKLVEMNLCKNGKQIEIFKEKKLFSKSQKDLTLYLDTGFNSNIKLMINDEVIIDTLIETSPISEPIIYHYSYKVNNDIQILKIKTDTDCLETILDKNYSILGLYNYSNKWTLSYRKDFPILE
ncbi:MULTISPECIES: hypothetical protein [unclassified Empedobacter]|uniref:hypothetical protein n=1 Tax=unclassified Empedobacter TaxID=2643773 RepID=UPI0024487899|nr:MULTISPECIES: hypothetical protein [unclassified Empedobacter]MDH0659328.1 hypothetical protein [Empedobacter sp. GD03865]MDH0675648.1 hypothetical protein [Empedobacter sp. GD03861]